MTFNDFQRELTRRNIPENVAYMFAVIYERQIELSKQVDLCGKVMVELANSLKGFVDLHEQTQINLKKVMRGGRPDGIEVESVMNDPEDKH